MNLRREGGRPLVIGHRGAAAVARENSRAALEEAVAAGADLVEFDVLAGLAIGHSPADGASAELTLDGALELLAPHPIGLHVDLKAVGIEAAAVAAVRARGLEERVLFSTAFVRSARRLATLADGMPVAIGYPRDRFDVSRIRWPEQLTAAAAATLRAAMPVRLPLLGAAARADVVALHHTLCSPAAVRAAHRGGRAVLGWTANEPSAVRRLAAAGVDGIVSDDPRMALATLTSP